MLTQKITALFANYHNKEQKLDSILLFSLIFVLIFSSIMIFSASNIVASHRFNDPFFFLKRQIIWSIIAFFALIFGYSVHYKKWREYNFLIMLISFLLLILVLIPGIGHSVGGARRWIRIGFFGIQPSEIAKIAFIFYTASWLDRKYQVMNNNILTILPKFFMLALTILLIYLEPDLGTTIMILLVVFSMYFVAGLNKKYIINLGLMALPLIIYSLLKTPYRLKRLIAFMNPWEHFKDTGYQLVQSYLAIANSSFLGRGLGSSKLKLLYLPEAHTDFIFSIIIEELGILGVAVVFIFFGFFSYVGLKTTINTQNYFAKMVALGITTMIAYQAIMNIAVVTGAIPTKGIPLPFFSFGGSSLVISMFASGVLLNIAKETRKENK